MGYMPTSDPGTGTAVTRTMPDLVFLHRVLTTEWTWREGGPLGCYCLCSGTAFTFPSIEQKCSQ